MGLNFTGNNVPQNTVILNQDEDDEILDLITDYNEKFKNAKPIMFRDEVIQQTLSILIGKNKPNPLLIGSAGVGKTKIIEDIAMRIANDDPLIPTQLLDSTIYELPISNLTANSMYRGQLEERVKKLIDFLKNEDNKAILFIDEIHQIVSNSSANNEIAQILKPALSRGDIKIIGATTLQEYQNFMKDPALNRRFSTVIVDEFNKDQTVEILKSLKTDYITHYNNQIAIDDKILTDIVNISDEYSKAGSHRPDTAITLLDRTCSDMIIEKNAKINQAIQQNNQTIVNILKQTNFTPISKNHLFKTAMKIATGTNKQIEITKDGLEERLSEIKGQDNVIKEIIKTIIRDNLKLYPRTRPLTMLFAGKSGVGKTQTAKILADYLSNEKLITLNMTGYSDNMSITKIIGSSAGYVGYDSNQEMIFDSLESNPYQVILLDEFEKAHRSIQRLFMSAFDEGYIKTAKGKIIDFSKSIIITTTNASHTTNKQQNSIGFNKSQEKTTKEETVSSLSNWFDLELLNRINLILTFNPIEKEDYKEILQNIYIKDIKRIKENSQRQITLSDKLTEDELENIAKETYIRDFGARPAKKAIKDYIENQFI